jgi:hypothetical protein
MRVCSARLCGLLFAVLALAACASAPAPPAEHGILEHRRPAPPPLPDPAEKLAGRFAALVLAGRPDSAAEVLQSLQEEDRRLRAEGNPPTGLVDNSRDLLHTLAGPAGYQEQTLRLLEEENLDPALRRRLEDFLEHDPLRIADQRVRDDRLRKTAAIFNRLVYPFARFAAAGALNPVETGRAALAAVLILHSFPDATPQERQALRAYQEFLERNPDSPEAARVVALVERYGQKWRRQLHGEALDVAERALESGRPDVAHAHLARAGRLLPEDHRARDLRARADGESEATKRREALALSSSTLVGIPLSAELRLDLQDLLVATLIAPAGEVAAHARAFEEHHGAGPLSDELMLLVALPRRVPGDEDGFFDAIAEIARLNPKHSNMARHAGWIRANPEQAPYLHYRAALRADRNERLLYVALGSRRKGPVRRDLPRPLEWILDAPGLATTLLFMPVRLLTYPAARKRFTGAAVIDRGEHYLRRFPIGAHAEEVHRDLEDRYAAREQWSRALEHHRSRQRPDRDTVARYRRRVAEQALEAARLERRWDVRALLYREVFREYADTPEASVARTELQALLRETTPQNIRLSREFLVENPEIWGPGALGLPRTLLDGDERNGELAEEGVTLLGQTYVRVALEEREPIVESLPPEQFARFVALLQEAQYRHLVTDTREQAEVDPQRDLFFERARLGLLSQPDTRPTASSEAQFLSAREKFGFVRRQEPLIPVELVVSGDLEGFGLAAYPRLIAPRESEDTWLYR